MLLKFDEIIKIRCSRIGIIPYVKRNGNIYFLMGADGRTGDLCDFGGRKNRGETNIQAAVREFMEETKEILDPSNLNQVSCGVFDKRNSICILFCEVNNPTFFEEAHNLFHTTNVIDEYEEMSEIEWLSKEDMIQNIYGYPTRFWTRVKYALSNSADFNDDLLNML